jgi:putative tryptophan/tyrosine transport system substrate-binding protein
MRDAARGVGRQLQIVHASNNQQIDAAFARLVESGVDGLVVIPDPVFTSRTVQIVTLATRHRVPAIYQSREWAEAGGLMSYGANLIDVCRQVGIYTGRVLRGVNPADLPIEQSSKVEFVINLQRPKHSTSICRRKCSRARTR